MSAVAETVRQKGPRVWLDMDQKELDDAYDQAVYAPNSEQVGGFRIVLRGAGAPGAAVDRHHDGRVRLLREVEVELLDLARPVSHALRRAEARTHSLAIARQTL